MPMLRSSVLRALLVLPVPTLALGAPPLAAIEVSDEQTVARPPLLRTITVDLHQADIVNVIRLFAEVAHKNVVIADDVKGKVTMRLREVPWRTALDVVLRSGGYGLVEEDNVLWVTSQARLDAEEQRDLDLVEARASKGPLATRIVPVNNADATEMATIVRALLSPRGSVAVDVRTNTLIIRDVRGSLALRGP